MISILISLSAKFCVLFVTSYEDFLFFDMLSAVQQQSSNTHFSGPLTLSTKPRFQRLPQQISQICLQIRFLCLLVHSFITLYVRIVPLLFLSPEISHLQGLCRICVLLEHRRLKRRFFDSDFSVFFPAFFSVFSDLLSVGQDQDLFLEGQKNTSKIS